ncbi:MAG: hypothetical protein CMQ19_01865 [Gammaproteobacteria bacterium]|nr:hypothetical protein [Gammaproteobacteria bacterium]
MRSVFYGVLLTVFVACAGSVQAANDLDRKARTGVVREEVKVGARQRSDVQPAARGVTGGDEGVANGCSNARGACVSSVIAGREIVSSSVRHALVSVLRVRLETGSLGDFRFEPNKMAMEQFVNGPGRIYGPVFDSLMNTRLPEFPDLRHIHQLQSMMPPIDQNQMDQSIAKDIASLQAQYGIEAMLMAMADIKDMAIGSGGGILPALAAGLGAVTADAWLAATVSVGLAVAGYFATQPGDYDDGGDLDGDGIPNNRDRDKDGDGKFSPALEGEEEDEDDWDSSKIIAETEGRMMLTTLTAPYQMMQSMQQVFSMYGNMFYQVRY